MTRRSSAIRGLALIALCMLLTGCMKRQLSVQMDYLSRENLASSYVNTPDICVNNPPIGQRLMLTWAIPEETLTCDDLKILLTIRYGNHEDAEVEIHPNRSSGMYIYSLRNSSFFEKCGIITYKVELFAGDCLLDSVRHQLWAELITIE